jgi:pimeloyl-ACP methyl ester carboxylesterase
LQISTRNWTLFVTLFYLFAPLSQNALAQTSTPSSKQLTKECIEEPVFNGTACIFHHITDQTKETVVLVHGINGSGPGDWHKQINKLIPKYNVLTFDLPGFGESSKTPKNYTPEAYVRFLNFITQRFTSKPFYLVGHSLCVTITLLYTAQYPDTVKRAVITDAAGILHKIAYSKSLVGGWAERYLGEPFQHFLEGVTGEILNRAELLHDKRFEVKPNITDGPDFVAGHALSQTDFSEYLDNISTPILIIWQENDYIAPIRTGIALAARLPLAKLEVIKGDGHMPMQNHPDKFNQLLFDFFNIPIEQFRHNNSKKQTIPRTSKAIPAICKNKRNVVFEGNYEKIELFNCAGIKIINSRIKQIYAYETRFEVINSIIESDSLAVEVVGSEAAFTGTQISGDIAIEASRSRLDLAGVELQGKTSSIAAKNRSEFLFSISRMDSPKFQGTIHNLINLTNGMSQ